MVISYLGFFSPAAIFFHSKIASPGAIARPVRNASFQKFVLVIPSERIEEKPVGEFEPPGHHLDLTLTRFVGVDDRLHGLWTQIIAGGKISVFKTGLHLEYTRDLLFVGLTFEPSTHSKPPRARLSP
jgi:hypothetical protein